jgi:hypothetical protein
LNDRNQQDPKARPETRNPTMSRSHGQIIRARHPKASHDGGLVHLSMHWLLARC